MFYRAKTHHFELIFDIFDIRQNTVDEVRHLKDLPIFHRVKTRHLELFLTYLILGKMQSLTCDQIFVIRSQLPHMTQSHNSTAPENLLNL